MKSNQFIGLVKFFRNEEYLNLLLDGCFHCTPPEIYRMDNQEGVSDKFESCVFSYRKEREDEPIELSIAGHTLKETKSITLHNQAEKDAWLHCWFTLRVPDSPESLENLKEDVQRMKKEFGQHYAFIPAPNLKPLIERLEANSDKQMFCSEVKYSGDTSRWGNLVKDLSYSYQREYRFLFGECSSAETDFYIFQNPNGLADLIYKNIELKMQSKCGQQVHFDLSE